MITINRLHINAIVGSIQTIISGVALFVVLKLVIKNCGIVNFGAWSLLISYITLLRILELGLPGALVKIGAELHAKKNKIEFQSTFSTCLTWVVFVNLFIILGFLFFEKLIYEKIQETTYSLEILPLAILVSLSTSIANVPAQTLTSVGMMWMKGIIQIIGTLTLLILTGPLTERYGIKGYGLAFIVQNIIVFIFSSIILWRLEKIKIKFSVNLNVLVLMFKYGVPFQITSLTQMMYDPITKSFLAYFGSFQAVAIFEITSKVVLMARQIIVSAAEALVPHFAKLQVKNNESIEKKLKEILPFITILSYTGCAVLISTSPISSYIFLGHLNFDFILYSTILTFAWFANIPTVPSYFAALGTGRQSANLWSHFVIGVLNILFSFIFGFFFGVIGVVVGWGFSVIFGSWLGAILFARESGISIQFNDFLTSKYYYFGLVLNALVLYVLWLNLSFIDAILAFFCIVCVTIGVIIFSPQFKFINSSLKK